MTRFRRRVGSSPAQRGSLSGSNCPDILQLDTGDYLVIGRHTTVDAQELAEHGASIDDDEAAVIIPARLLHDAATQLATENPGTVDYTTKALNVTALTRLRPVVACESGRHVHHAGLTCAEVDELRESFMAKLDAALNGPTLAEDIAADRNHDVRQEGD